MKRYGSFIFYSIFLLFFFLNEAEKNCNDNSHDLSRDVIELLIQSEITSPQDELATYVENNIYSQINNADIFTAPKKGRVDVDRKDPYGYQQLIGALKKNDIRSIETIHYFTKHKIAVIGRLTDTDYYRKLRFCDVLSEKGWSKAINIEWLQNIASHHQWVYVASPLNIKNIFTMDDQNNNITFFAVELSFLIKSGYKILGNWLIPVKPYEPVINMTGRTKV